jgi:hypothetical protein
LGQKPSPVSPTGALLLLSAGSSAPFGLNASHLGKAVPFKRHAWPFRPGLSAFRAPAGLLFRDRDPISGQGTNSGQGTIRDREPFRDREPRSRRGFCFTIPGWEPLCSARGNQVCDDSVATIPDPSWRPRIDPPWRPRTERIGIAPRVGGKGNQFRVCVRAVSRRTVRPSFLGVHRSRPPCSRQMRRSARQPALSTSARRYPEHRSPIGTLPGGSGVQLVGDTRFRLCGKPETRHGGCRPKATVKQRPMELVWVCVPPEGGSGGRKRLSLSNVGIEPTTFRLWGLRSTTAPQLWCSKVTPKSRPIPRWSIFGRTSQLGIGLRWCLRTWGLVRTSQEASHQVSQKSS